MFLLWHGDDVDPGPPERLLLGVYSTEEKAQDRIVRSLTVSGFEDFSEAFQITEYELDKDHWIDGFSVLENVNIEVLEDGLRVWKPVQAVVLASGLHRLLTDASDGQDWILPSGSTVRCEPRDGALYAIEVVPVSDQSDV